MDLGPGDGRCGEDSGWGVRQGLRLGLEAAAKIAISLGLRLEPHLKQETIFLWRGLWDPLGLVSSWMVNKNMPINTA